MDHRVPEIPARAVAEGKWVCGRINAGEVLIFRSLAVRTATPNLSNQLRISLDCMFQDYRRVLHPANLAFAGESCKSREKTTAGWRSNELKSYWRQLPLKFKIQELSGGDCRNTRRVRYLPPTEGRSVYAPFR